MKGRHIFLIAISIGAIILSIANLDVWAVISLCISIFVLVIDSDEIYSWRANSSLKKKLADEKIKKLDLKLNKLQKQIEELKKGQ